MRQAVEVAEVARAEAAQVDQANAEALAEAAQARKRAQLTAKQADGLVEEAKTKGGLATQTLRHALSHAQATLNPRLTAVHAAMGAAAASSARDAKEASESAAMLRHAESSYEQLESPSDGRAKLPDDTVAEAGTNLEALRQAAAEAAEQADSTSHASDVASLEVAEVQAELSRVTTSTESTLAELQSEAAQFVEVVDEFNAAAIR